MKPTTDVVDRVPITNVALDVFPHFTWPVQDRPQNTPVNRDDGHFLSWTGASFRDVAGKTYLVTVLGANDHEQQRASVARGRRNAARESNELANAVMF